MLSLRKYKVKLYDYRSSKNANITSNIVLRPYQEPCINALDNHINGILLIPCGLGKTECALALAAHLKQKTLFIAHTKDLINQAESRCRNSLVCKTSFITDGKVDLSGDIVFATVQTLSKKLEEINQSEFGYVVCDEVHHLAANAQTVGMFRECLDYFAARYKLGLTATLHRADGLEVCIPRLLGDVMYEIRQDGNDYVGIYEGNEILRFPMSEFQVPANVNFIVTNYKICDEQTGRYRDVFDKNGMTISFSKLLTDIGSDSERNKLIISLCNSLQGSTIILSDRVEQLKYLAEHINNCVEIDGGTKKDAREQALVDVSNGKKKVLLASYKLAKEGLDCKILQNIILATPIKDEAVVIQCIGRIQRPYKGKEIANVYDLVDDVSTLTRFYKKRKSIYKKKGWLHER
jgi:superfamily II DNA or RNA helicase